MTDLHETPEPLFWGGDMVPNHQYDQGYCNDYLGSEHFYETQVPLSEAFGHGFDYTTVPSDTMSYYKKSSSHDNFKSQVPQLLNRFDNQILPVKDSHKNSGTSSFHPENLDHSTLHLLEHTPPENFQGTLNSDQTNLVGSVSDYSRFEPGILSYLELLERKQGASNSKCSPTNHHLLDVSRQIHHPNTSVFDQVDQSTFLSNGAGVTTPCLEQTPTSLPPNHQMVNGDDPSSIRERKIMRYRAKRSTRNFCPNIDKRLRVQAQMRERDQSGHFLPSKKAHKTQTPDILKRLIMSEKECCKLRVFMEAANREIHVLRHVLEDQQREIVALSGHSNGINNMVRTPNPCPSDGGVVSATNCNNNLSAMVAATSCLNYSGIVSNSESSVTVLPYMMPNLVPEEMLSNEDLMVDPRNDTMNMHHGVHEGVTSNGTLEHGDMNVLPVPENRLQEKLKKLGGPPSDVYCPWWNGINLQHPAFKEKEDWPNNKLRPVSEDPNFSALGRERLDYILAQQRWKQEQMFINAKCTSGGDKLSSHEKAPGYWSGNFVPRREQKIDFSKISLRKTTMMPPPPMQEQGPSMMIPTPTAAIWRQAMANPEFFRSHYV